MLLEWVVPRLMNRAAGFEIAPAHFVERHGLVVIVALGESVVAVGIGAAGLPVDLPLVLVAVLGLVLNAALWWTYFGGDDKRAERALLAAAPEDRPQMAIDGFGAWHLVILLGIRRLTSGSVGDEQYRPAAGSARLGSARLRVEAGASAGCLARK